MSCSGVGGAGGVSPAHVMAADQEPKRRAMVEAVQGRWGHLLNSDWRRERGAKVRRASRRSESVSSGGSWKSSAGFMGPPLWTGVVLYHGALLPFCARAAVHRGVGF